LSKVRDYMVLLGIASVVVALDQWSKYLVRTNLNFGEAWSPMAWLLPYARILHSNNTGAAFGLFPAGATIFTVVAIIVALAILYYFPQVPSNQRALRLALSLQLGGALGNLVDRLFIGTVTDFISLGTFPVFNVADSSISIGTAILVVTMFILERRESLEAAMDEPSPGGEPEEAGSEMERPLG
jgi:signal peptidase II